MPLGRWTSLMIARLVRFVSLFVALRDSKAAQDRLPRLHACLKVASFVPNVIECPGHIVTHKVLLYYYGCIKSPIETHSVSWLNLAWGVQQGCMTFDFFK